MKKIALLSALFIAFTSSIALAAEPETPNQTEKTDYHSWYAGIGLNLDFPYHSDIEGASSGSIDYKDSFTLPEVFVGYRPEGLFGVFGDFRFEEELVGHGYGIDKRNGPGASTGKKGALGTAALMTNIYYDIHTRTSFTPFVGAGIGISQTRFSKNPGYGITDKTCEDLTMAYQFKAGVSYMPSGWTNVSFILAYDYFNAGSPEFDAGNAKEKIKDVSSNGVELSVSYAF